MKPLFLLQMGPQLIGIDKECVIGIAVRDDNQIKPVEEGGKIFLPLPHGNRAMICDTALIGKEGATLTSKREHYLILVHEDNLMALTMSSRGRMVMADVGAALPLPPAFSDQSRELIPLVLINCSDLILLPDLRALLAVTDRAASRLHANTTTLVKKA